MPGTPSPEAEMLHGVRHDTAAGSQDRCQVASSPHVFAALWARCRFNQAAIPSALCGGNFAGRNRVSLGHIGTGAKLETKNRVATMNTAPASPASKAR